SRRAPGGATPATLKPSTADVARHIGESIAAPAADSVDKEARFPTESIDALKDGALLSALVPTELGGAGLSVREVAEVCEILGRHCASTAMVFAMHQIQVACILRHGATPFFSDYLSHLVTSQDLIASATSETGVGGDVRRSVCSVEQQGEQFRLEKKAPVISYGQNANAFLITARRSTDAAPSDQVLVLAHQSDVRLDPTSDWNALGFRGTCSLGFNLFATGDTAQILPDEFAQISSHTMLPVSHILWSSLWAGIAADALSRARNVFRAEARKTAGVLSPGAVRAAKASGALQLMRSNIVECIREYESNRDNADVMSSLGFAIRMNNLKVASSTGVVNIVGQAMLIAGMAGYRTDSPLSLGRHLRDAYGAVLMINNDRVDAATASLLMVHKDD
ncbi:MAG: acyl-CoA dehydrogenase family protein, partial [Gemmatimonadaceae bacterium]